MLATSRSPALDPLMEVHFLLEACGARVRLTWLRRPPASLGDPDFAAVLIAGSAGHATARPAASRTLRSSPRAVYPGLFVRVTSSCRIRASYRVFRLFKVTEVASATSSHRVHSPSAVPVRGDLRSAATPHAPAPTGFLDPLGAFVSAPSLPEIISLRSALGVLPFRAFSSDGSLEPLSSRLPSWRWRGRYERLRAPRLQGIDPHRKPTPAAALSGTAGRCPLGVVPLQGLLPSGLPVLWGRTPPRASPVGRSFRFDRTPAPRGHQPEGRSNLLVGSRPS